MLCTVHIVYGTSQPNDATRVREIELISEFLKKRAKAGYSYSDALVLLGDFNIFKPTDKTMAAITKAGVRDSAGASGDSGSNVPKNKHYDQIAFLPSRRALGFTGNAGIFDFFESVYRDTDEKLYAKAMGAAYRKSSKGTTRNAASRSRYYKTYWRTHQMSDHLLMWTELKIDFSDEYLAHRAGQ